jgi:hypothetical protein
MVHLTAAVSLFAGGTITEALRLYFLWCQSRAYGLRTRAAVRIQCSWKVMHIIRDAQKAGITCNKTGAAALLDATVELNSMNIKTVKDLKEAMELEDGGKFMKFLTAKRQEAHDAGLPADKQNTAPPRIDGVRWVLFLCVALAGTVRAVAASCPVPCACPVLMRCCMPCVRACVCRHPARVGASCGFPRCRSTP